MKEFLRFVGCFIAVIAFIAMFALLFSSIPPKDYDYPDCYRRDTMAHGCQDEEEPPR